jgi:hypothetical protein
MSNVSDVSIKMRNNHGLNRRDVNTSRMHGRKSLEDFPSTRSALERRRGGGPRAEDPGSFLGYLAGRIRPVRF